MQRASRAASRAATRGRPAYPSIRAVGGGLTSENHFALLAQSRTGTGRGEAAADKEMVAAFDFTDAGVSPKSIRVINGKFSAEPDISADAEIVLKLDSVTFEKGLRQIQSFNKSLETGDLQIGDRSGLEKFFSIFPAFQ